MKTLYAILASLVLVLTLAGCEDDEGPIEESAEEVEEAGEEVGEAAEEATEGDD